jgi:hypothetical protein
LGLQHGGINEELRPRIQVDSGLALRPPPGAPAR